MKPKTKIFFIVVTLFFLSVPMQAQTKRALVIGLGQQLDKSWGKINGDKDVVYVQELLNDAGYKDISTLVNSQATKNAIVDGFKRLAASCNTGDIVYVHYSGHGQQMYDRHNDEKDSLDECWIPYDAYKQPIPEKYNGEKHLTDDEVNKLLMEIRNKVGETGKILVVIDACHSGTATRGTKRKNSRVEDGAVRGVKEIFRTLMNYFPTPQENEPHRNIRENKERWITLSACESKQVNTELKTPSVGKLTYAIYMTVKNKDFGDNDYFFGKVKRFVDTHTYSNSQRPTKSGETNKYNIIDFFK